MVQLRRSRVVAASLVASLVFVLLTVAPEGPRPAHAEDTRPNILLIVTDDQRLDSMGAMPLTQARIFEVGLNFSSGFVTTPLCCPSRSSILTGMYAGHHGVRTNQIPLTIPTFVTRLHDAGYYTGMFGKYLNSQDGSPLPEFDEWAGVREQPYIDPVINLNGAVSAYDGYATYIIRDFAQNFLAQAARRSGPFMMLFAPKASHEPNTPAPGDENLFPDLEPLRPPSHNEADVSDKPNWARKFPLLTTAEIQSLDDQRRRMWQALHSADLAIGSLLDTLEGQGELDNTLVVFISDNGFLLGEHRQTRKSVLYEESVRVPFAVRYDPLVSAPRVDSRLVANIDIAPTIYELAGIPIPSEVDGRSLVPLLRADPGGWREDLLLEGPPYQPSVAVHTGDWVYAEREGDIAELYDLGTDPHQVSNLSQDPAYDAKEAEMKARLDAYSDSGGGDPGGNLVRNGGFEEDGDNNGRPDQWTNSSKFTRTTAVVHGDASSGRHSAIDNKDHTITQTIGGVTPGASYAFSGWVNIPATTDLFSFKAQVRWLNSSGGTISTKTVRTYTAATPGWNAATATVVAPSAATQAQVRMVVKSLKGTIYVDDFALE